MQYECQYPSLHACLKACLGAGEHGLVTWFGIGTTGSMDVQNRAGRIQYTSCPYPKVQHLAKTMRYLTLVVRVFDRTNVFPVGSGNPIPMKRVYSCVWMDGAHVLKVSPEDCRTLNLVDGSPEPATIYM
jgi:hypothetical protein